MLQASPTLLDYASPRAARQPWGPVFFHPSRRSILLFTLTVAVALWLAQRHTPWRRIATIPCDYVTFPLFTADGPLLAFDTALGAHLYDPATGRLVRTVLPKIDVATYRYFVIKDGQQILALPWTERVALLYDVASGRLLDRLPNPDGLGSLLAAVAPDDPRVITVDVKRTATQRMLLWDLAAPHAGTRPPTPLLRGIQPAFSPDGRRILQSFATSDAGFQLFDANGVLIGWQTYPALLIPPNFRPTEVTTGFLPDNRFWVARTNRLRRIDLVELRSLENGELIRESTLASAGIAWRVSAVSDDGALIALWGPPGLPNLDVIDTYTGNSIMTRSCDPATLPRFFPRSHRLLLRDAGAPDLSVVDPHHPTRTLAKFAPDTPANGIPPVIAPNARAIVTGNGTTLTLHRLAGPDCPESPLGVLAFPQTWLTIGLFPLLTLSLTADAGRAGRASAIRPPPVLQPALLLVLTPLALYSLLAACLGQLVLSPAPILLVAAVGLATRSRVWRVANLSMLAATLPLTLYLARRMQLLGLKNTRPYPLLDRAYDIPHVLPFAALTLATVFLIPALALLARPSRAA